MLSVYLLLLLLLLLLLFGIHECANTVEKTRMCSYSSKGLVLIRYSLTNLL
jgi:hypothetical protein